MESECEEEKKWLVLGDDVPMKYVRTTTSFEKTKNEIHYVASNIKSRFGGLFQQ